MRALLVVVALAAAAQAASWEATRRGVVDPLNSALHRHLPSHLKARDLEALLGLYATDAGTGLVWDGGEAVYTGREEEMVRWGRLRGPEPIRQRYQRLLDLLATIERAELRIDEVRWREAAPDGVPVDVHLIVRGARSDGARIQLDQRARLRVVERGGAWVITHEEITARETVARAVPRYDLATEPAGVHNTHTNASSPVFRLFGDGSQGTPVGNSAGSAVADVDGDGCEDVFLAGDPGAALYRNGCDGTFTDVTAEAGLPVPYPAAASGTVFFDYDNDGWPDLYVAAVRGGDRLFRNTGGGRFADVSGPARIPAGRWTSMPAVADYDRDGFLDVYLVRMGDHERTAPRPNYDARNGVGNALLHNNGDGTFSDATSRAGVGNRGWNLAGAWGDYDGDGWPDLYVANEFGGNVLYHNEGDGTFSDRTEASGTADGGAGMGVAWADYDGDGDLDLFVSNMHANSRWALFHPEFPSPVPWPFRVLGRFTPEVERRTRGILDRLTRGSTLFRNDGDGTFTDVSDAAGVRDAQWGWAAQFLDIGQHSLNGYERDCLFRNNGDGTFTDVAFVNAADRIEDGRGLSVVDYDGDGQLDLLLRNYRQPAQLLRNRGGAGHWIALKLAGTRSNRDAVGARIRLRTARGWQTRIVSAGSGYLSGHTLVQHFGLGEERRAAEVRVAWPSGASTTLYALAADRRYELVEGADGARAAP